ncbi:MAG: hypothetical protein NZ901_07645 [Geminocystis sp.]|nr:hypothetical protein [Geminocystis sp.]HIK36843.1 hypothetical protein [Geminocystis sp. M7585_C2015_104]MCS7148045.1 hypothetical protein [Geminocystis sp.]MCX8077789.1 hypothetical protein [Geminocystis sp.]MDW8116397.1 hypothetical protein [Geminocystis sp.]
MKSLHILPLVFLLLSWGSFKASSQTTRDILYYKRLLQQVDNICQSLTVSSLRENCNNLLKSSIFFDPDAIYLCGKKFRPHSTNILECLSAIRDRVYVQSEIRKCDRMITSPQTIECLQKGGREVVYGGCPLLEESKNLPGKKQATTKY